MKSFAPNELNLRKAVAEWMTADASGHVEGVIYTGALDLRSPSAADEFEPEKLMELSCGKVLDILDGFADAQTPKLPRLWLTTRGAQAAGGNDNVDVSSSPLWGLGRVIAVEMPEVDCVRIDLDSAPSETDAVAVWQEVVSNGRETQVAYRGDERFVARLQRIEKSDGGAVSIRSDCTYLITGGLGGLGLKLAQWLVNRGARHLAADRPPSASAEALEILRAVGSGRRKSSLCRRTWGKKKMSRVFLSGSMPNCRPLGGVFHAAGSAGRRHAAAAKPRAFPHGHGRESGRRFGICTRSRRTGLWICS